MLLPRLVIVTDRRATRGRPLVQVVRRALEAAPRAAVWIQLRENDLAGGPLLALARELGDAARAVGGKLLVNDRIDVAIAAGADGVQLPEAGLGVADARALLGPRAVIGRSVHGVAAAATDADFALLGPIWATPSKAAYGAPLGPGVLTQLRGRPVIAVGGIDGPARAEQARAAGAAAVAVIRAVMAADDPGAAAAALCGP